MRRWIKFFSFVAVILLALPTVARAIDFGGISARPANPDPGDERTSAWFVHTLSPGSSKTDALTVANNTDQEKTLDLYPADSTPTTGGGFALKQRAEKMTAVGHWVTLEQNSITLAPHQKISVPFRLALPADAAPGLYAGGIMVAERGEQKESNGVNIDLRMGVRIYVTVAGDFVKNDMMRPNNPFLPYLAAAGFIGITLAASYAYFFLILKRKNKFKSKRR